jgi:hypothetical protein
LLKKYSPRAFENGNKTMLTIFKEIKAVLDGTMAKVIEQATTVKHYRVAVNKSESETLKRRKPCGNLYSYL